MDTAEIVVTVSGILLIGAILWFFFGPRTATAAQMNQTGVQEIDVLVKGGYLPDRVEVQRGRPVRLNFQRQETNPCTEQVLLPDFGIVQDLPYGKRTTVELMPSQTGEFPFHCGMNMVRGKIIVKESQ